MSEFKLVPEVGNIYLREVSINRSTGAVILLARENNEDLLYKFSFQDGSYNNEWRRQCLENKLWIYSYLTDTGDVIMQDLNDDTYLFDQDMQLIDSWHHKGDFITCLPGARTVYKVEKSGYFVIDIRSQDGEILRLNSEGWTKDYAYSNLNVCEDVTTGRLAVLNHDTKISAIDIFSQDGKSQHIVINLLFRIQSTENLFLAY